MKTRNLVQVALFVTAGLLLPMVFHQFGMGGPMFLPMHIPVLLAGLLLGKREGLIVGMITPIVSSILTGMPPVIPMLPIMFFELATYGFIVGLLYKEMKLHLIPSLLLAMLGGRIIVGLVVFVMGTGFGFNLQPIDFVIGAITTGVPGIIIQFITIPLVVSQLEKVYARYQLTESY